MVKVLAWCTIRVESGIVRDTHTGQSSKFAVYIAAIVDSHGKEVGWI